MTDQPPPPIRIPCEGSDYPAHHPSMNSGMCSMCGATVTCRDDGTTWPHDRNDVLAMLDRGDFEERLFETRLEAIEFGTATITLSDGTEITLDWRRDEEQT